MAYTLMLEMQRKRTMPKLINRYGVGSGYKIHRRRAKKSPAIGAIRNGVLLAGDGAADSFINSFIASAIGWGKPVSITLFGPFRSWKYARHLRSRRV